MNGIGLVEQLDGSSYFGEWKDGENHGFGAFKCAQSHYKGEWKAHAKNGYGYETQVDGYIYYGEWKNGKREGYGLLKYPNGDIYDGQWLAHKKHGEGWFFEAQRQIKQKGKFENGGFVSWMTVDKSKITEN